MAYEITHLQFLQIGSKLYHIILAAFSLYPKNINVSFVPLFSEA